MDFVTLRPEGGGDAEGGHGIENDGDRAVIQRGDEIPGLRGAGARVGHGEVLGAGGVGDGERAGGVGHDLGGGAVLDGGDHGCGADGAGALDVVVGMDAGDRRGAGAVGGCACGA